MSIHFLSPEDAQKVAAGEVIERPANIIKELLENSIDAKATRIELSVIDGGKTLIQIADNGTGMSSEDAHLCFERHATSKLVRFDDLYAVNTFGFRGEALASVCGVARVTLTTKIQGLLEGLQLQIEEGKVLSSSVVSCPVGTTFIIKDLFYNIPVRKKFLKTTTTEWNQIVLLFKAFCLVYPQVHFILCHDGVQVYNCPPVTSVAERAYQLFDERVHATQLEIAPTTNKGIAVQGVITNPQYSRYDRSGFYFFVNNRLVKNYQLARAVMKGYSHVLPPDKYPMAVIQISIDPLQVDVNIHPKKEEVLFLHPHLVEQAITQAVKTTLETHVSRALHKKPSVNNLGLEDYNDLPREASWHRVEANGASRIHASYAHLSHDDLQAFKKAQTLGSQALKAPFSIYSLDDPLPFVERYNKPTNGLGQPEFFDSFAPYTHYQQSKNALDDPLPLVEGQNQPAYNSFKYSTPQNQDQLSRNQNEHSMQHPTMGSSASEQSFQQPAIEKQHYHIVGQLHATYILLEHPDGMLVVDQHAAHERILYERFKNRFGAIETIQLLFPPVVTLSKADCEHILSHEDIFKEHGILIEHFGQAQIRIKSVPVYAKQVPLQELLEQVVGWITENDSLPSSEIGKKVTEKMRAQLACKAAVKAGDVLSHEQMTQLLQDLEKTESRFSCPHGRPTQWLLGTYEIEKKFKRVS